MPAFLSVQVLISKFSLGSFRVRLCECQQATEQNLPSTKLSQNITENAIPMYKT